MDIHKNARLTPAGREGMVRRVVEGGRSLRSVAGEFGLTARTVSKWVERYRVQGVAGLVDRSSRPHHCPQAISRAVLSRIEHLRRQRLTGSRIARTCGVSPATVSRVLRRLGLNRIRMLEPPEPVRRYQRKHPGELIHLDIKKLRRFDRPGHRVTGNRCVRSRGVGWECLHVCIDDASRVAHAEFYPNERADSAVSFLKSVVKAYRRLGVVVRSVMTDNGSAYRSRAFTTACRKFELRHLRTRPYRPQTNGKAERFIQTALREWAYARAYRHDKQRRRALPQWIHHYNWHRPHGSLNAKPPMQTLRLTEDNVLTLHT